ncbi:MAG: DUF3892 domain-containing protein [Myxococcales bacterium]|nr:DUF3892 domain-containing protein [Myxococcales bacterium]
MADNRIKYATKSGTTHEHITHLGNDTETWPVADVVRRIDGRVDTFYTFEAGTRANVATRQGTYRKYVQTQTDGVWQNNLLALPPCRVRAA